MAATRTFAAGLFALAATAFSILAISPSAAAAAFGQRLAPERWAPERWAPERWNRSHTPSGRGSATRSMERRTAQPKRSPKDRGLGLILGRWCDDRGERWFFQREIVVHERHVHRARYERRKTSIVVMVDGYPDTFSRFTPDGLHMTLLSSVLDPALKLRRFTRCPELLSAIARSGRTV